MNKKEVPDLVAGINGGISQPGGPFLLPSAEGTILEFLTVSKNFTYLLVQHDFVGRLD